MKSELIKKLDTLKKKFGDVDGIILAREAFHACHPERPRSWKCDAIQISSECDRALKGYVWWDFDDVENYDEIEDASDFPWDNATKDDFEPDEEFDLTDNDDVAYLLRQI